MVISSNRVYSKFQNICSEVCTIIIIHLTMIGTKKLCVKGSAVCVKQWVFMIVLKRLSIQLISFTDTSSLILSQWHVFLSFLHTSDSEHVPISAYIFSSMFSVHGLVVVWSILKMKLHLLSDHFPWTT